MLCIGLLSHLRSHSRVTENLINVEDEGVGDDNDNDDDCTASLGLRNPLDLSQASSIDDDDDGQELLSAELGECE